MLHRDCEKSSSYIVFFRDARHGGTSETRDCEQWPAKRMDDKTTPQKVDWNLFGGTDHDDTKTCMDSTFTATVTASD